VFTAIETAAEAGCRQDVGIDRVNQGPVEIENQRFHSFPPYQIANDFPSEFALFSIQIWTPFTLPWNNATTSGCVASR
jgi:hypothetical protein